MRCPYCQCSDGCGRERSLDLPALSRAAETLAAVIDLYSKHRWAVVEIDLLYLSQELAMRGYFGENDPPTLVDVGGAQDLIREIAHQ